jgi:hypothetical protein
MFALFFFLVSPVFVPFFFLVSWFSLCVFYPPLFYVCFLLPGFRFSFSLCSLPGSLFIFYLTVFSPVLCPPVHSLFFCSFSFLYTLCFPSFCSLCQFLSLFIPFCSCPSPCARLPLPSFYKARDSPGGDNSRQ